MLKKYPTGSRRQLAEVSLEYVRFLVENPTSAPSSWVRMMNLICGGAARGQVSNLYPGPHPGLLPLHGHVGADQAAENLCGPLPHLRRRPDV